ncbi:PadR family transcriptional regulator [Salinibacterium sp. SYSU T00001]|uniref:PadR family transcriptional regulator n=1 Tax=Homoserinimonas sedimenticola TaxID=2986805 RepID=UPI0022355D96|nr:PadR family transcriptional regulator [Salinibacterium sedimenticola]MCW4385573.1 PadR family transcriptional regulator [Salinibacterium sedimenticola]
MRHHNSNPFGGEQHRRRHDFSQRRGFGPGDHPGRGAGFGPGFGPRGSRRAGRGDIRLAILSLLSETPSSGYGLITAIADKTSGAWRPSPGSVYPTLQQLVDEELIVPKGVGRRTEYELTDAGRNHVQENAEQLAQAWAGAPGRSEAETRFFESAAKLKGVIQQFKTAASDEQRDAASEKLDEARRALYLILAD